MSDINRNIDACSKGSEILTSIEYECRSLSKAFFITGNEIMGEQMHMIARGIHEGNDLMNGALSGEINDRCREAQRGVGEVLGMVLESTTRQMKEVLDEREN